MKEFRVFYYIDRKSFNRSQILNFKYLGHDYEYCVNILTNILEIFALDRDKIE